MDTTISQQPQAELIVPILDASLTNKIKHALELMNGVGKIKVRKISTVTRRKTGIEKGLDDLKNGRVYHAKDSADLIKQILG